MTREEREQAIDALKISSPVIAMTQEDFNDYIQTLNQVMDWLEQEPKTGHWIKYGKLYQCSECEELSCCQGKFCNECGAKMVEPTCDTCEYTTAAFNPCNACKDKSEYKPKESEDKE